MYGGHIVVLARRCLERIGTNDSESQIVVILAAAAVEAFLNDLEVYADLANKGTASAVTADLLRALRLAEQERATTLLKVNMVYLAMTGHYPDPGSQPYQDIKLLFQLRNLVVHAKPESVELAESNESLGQPKIVRAFVSRGIIKSPPAGAPVAWRQYVIVPLVAAWAYDVTVRSLHWFAAAVTDPHLKQFLDLQLDGMTIVGSEQAGGALPSTV
ncbi:MAG: hypothetical protein U0Q11_27015 [Vicinamibacterales bacterium]